MNQFIIYKSWELRKWSPKIKVLMFKQVLPTNTQQNVWRPIRRIWILMLGLKGIIKYYCLSHDVIISWDVDGNVYCHFYLSTAYCVFFRWRGRLVMRHAMKADVLLWLVGFQQLWLAHFNPCCFTDLFPWPSITVLLCCCCVSWLWASMLLEIHIVETSQSTSQVTTSWDKW